MEGGRHGILSKMQRNFTQNVDLDSHDGVKNWHEKFSSSYHEFC